MNTPADKAPENRIPSATNERAGVRGGGQGSSLFFDSRTDLVAQRAQQVLASNSPQVSQLKTFHAIAHGSPQSSRAVQLQRVGNDHSEVIQRNIKMKQAGTPASRTDGSSQEIQTEVTNTIARGDIMEIETDINRLRTSRTHRQEHSAEFEVPDGGHEWRIDFEKTMMDQLQAVADAIHETEKEAAAATALIKEQKKDAKKKRKAAKKAQEEADAAEQEAADKEERDAAKAERKATRQAENRSTKEKAAAERKREADAAAARLKETQDAAEAKRIAKRDQLIGYGVTGAIAIITLASWFLT